MNLNLNDSGHQEFLSLLANNRKGKNESRRYTGLLKQYQKHNLRAETSISNKYAYVRLQRSQEAYKEDRNRDVKTQIRVRDSQLKLYQTGNSSFDSLKGKLEVVGQEKQMQQVANQSGVSFSNQNRQQPQRKVVLNNVNWPVSDNQTQMSSIVKEAAVQINESPPRSTLGQLPVFGQAKAENASINFENVIKHSLQSSTLKHSEVTGSFRTHKSSVEHEKKKMSKSFYNDKPQLPETKKTSIDLVLQQDQTQHDVSQQDTVLVNELSIMNVGASEFQQKNTLDTSLSQEDLNTFREDIPIASSKLQHDNSFKIRAQVEPRRTPLLDTKEFKINLRSFYLQSQQFQIYFIKFWKLFLKLQYDFGSKDARSNQVTDVTQIPLNYQIYTKAFDVLREPMVRQMNAQGDNASLQEQSQGSLTKQNKVIIYFQEFCDDFLNLFSAQQLETFTPNKFIDVQRGLFKFVTMKVSDRVTGSSQIKIKDMRSISNQHLGKLMAKAAENPGLPSKQKVQREQPEKATFHDIIEKNMNSLNMKNRELGFSFELQPAAPADERKYQSQSPRPFTVMNGRRQKLPILQNTAALNLTSLSKANGMVQEFRSLVNRQANSMSPHNPKHVQLDSIAKQSQQARTRYGRASILVNKRNASSTQHLNPRPRPIPKLHKGLPILKPTQQQSRRPDHRSPDTNTFILPNISQFFHSAGLEQDQKRLPPHPQQRQVSLERNISRGSPGLVVKEAMAMRQAPKVGLTPAPGTQKLSVDQDQVDSQKKVGNDGNGVGVPVLALKVGGLPENVEAPDHAVTGTAGTDVGTPPGKDSVIGIELSQPSIESNNLPQVETIRVSPLATLQQNQVFDKTVTPIAKIYKQLKQQEGELQQTPQSNKQELPSTSVQATITTIDQDQRANETGDREQPLPTAGLSQHPEEAFPSNGSVSQESIQATRVQLNQIKFALQQDLRMILLSLNEQTNQQNEQVPKDLKLTSSQQDYRSKQIQAKALKILQNQSGRNSVTRQSLQSNQADKRQRKSNQGNRGQAQWDRRSRQDRRAVAPEQDSPESNEREPYRERLNSFVNDNKGQIKALHSTENISVKSKGIRLSETKQSTLQRSTVQRSKSGSQQRTNKTSKMVSEHFTHRLDVKYLADGNNNQNFIAQVPGSGLEGKPNIDGNDILLVANRSDGMVKKTVLSNKAPSRNAAKEVGQDSSSQEKVTARPQDQQTPLFTNGGANDGKFYNIISDGLLQDEIIAQREQLSKSISKSSAGSFHVMVIPNARGSGTNDLIQHQTSTESGQNNTNVATLETPDVPPTKEQEQIITVSNQQQNIEEEASAPDSAEINFQKQQRLQDVIQSGLQSDNTTQIMDQSSARFLQEQQFTHDLAHVQDPIQPSSDPYLISEVKKEIIELINTRNGADDDDVDGGIRELDNEESHQDEGAAAMETQTADLGEVRRDGVQVYTLLSRSPGKNSIDADCQEPIKNEAVRSSAPQDNVDIITERVTKNTNSVDQRNNLLTQNSRKVDTSSQEFYSNVLSYALPHQSNKLTEYNNKHTQKGLNSTASLLSNAYNSSIHRLANPDTNMASRHGQQQAITSTLSPNIRAGGQGQTPLASFQNYRLSTGEQRAYESLSMARPKLEGKKQAGKTNEKENVASVQGEGKISAGQYNRVNLSNPRHDRKQVSNQFSSTFGLRSQSKMGQMLTPQLDSSTTNEAGQIIEQFQSSSINSGVTPISTKRSQVQQQWQQQYQQQHQQQYQHIKPQQYNMMNFDSLKIPSTHIEVPRGSMFQQYSNLKQPGAINRLTSKSIIHGKQIKISKLKYKMPQDIIRQSHDSIHTSYDRKEPTSSTVPGLNNASIQVTLRTDNESSQFPSLDVNKLNDGRLIQLNYKEDNSTGCLQQPVQKKLYQHDFNLSNIFDLIDPNNPSNSRFNSVNRSHFGSKSLNKSASQQQTLEQNQKRLAQHGSSSPRMMNMFQNKMTKIGGGFSFKKKTQNQTQTMNTNKNSTSGHQKITLNNIDANFGALEHSLEQSLQVCRSQHLKLNQTLVTQKIQEPLMDLKRVKNTQSALSVSQRMSKVRTPIYKHALVPKLPKNKRGSQNNNQILKDATIPNRFGFNQNTDDDLQSFLETLNANITDESVLGLNHDGLHDNIEKSKEGANPIHNNIEKILVECIGEDTMELSRQLYGEDHGKQIAMLIMSGLLGLDPYLLFPPAQTPIKSQGQSSNTIPHGFENSLDDTLTNEMTMTGTISAGGVQQYPSSLYRAWKSIGRDRNRASSRDRLNHNTQQILNSKFHREILDTRLQFLRNDIQFGPMNYNQDLIGIRALRIPTQMPNSSHNSSKLYSTNRSSQKLDKMVGNSIPMNIKEQQ